MAIENGLIKPELLKKIVVDSTVMTKAIAHPTDSKLLETSRDKHVEAARANGITLKQAIEPIIGHLKSDHRLERCYLKGQRGDVIHAVLCAAGYNFMWLMRMILQKGIKPFLPKNYEPCMRT